MQWWHGIFNLLATKCNRMKKILLAMLMASGAAIACNDAGEGSGSGIDTMPPELIDTLRPVVVDTTITRDTSDTLR